MDYQYIPIFSKGIKKKSNFKNKAHSKKKIHTNSSNFQKYCLLGKMEEVKKKRKKKKDEDSKANI